MLIGICGKAGSGKDTVGHHLIRKYKFEQIALADPLKRLVKDVFVLDYDTVYDRVLREQELPEWKGWSVRKLLQFIGTELFRQNIESEIWVKSLWLRVKNNPDKNYVVTDIRFPNELQFFIDNGGQDFVSFKTVRGGCAGNVGITGHESEQYDLEANFTFENNGTVRDLYRNVDSVMNILMK